MCLEQKAGIATLGPRALLEVQEIKDWRLSNIYAWVAPAGEHQLVHLRQHGDKFLKSYGQGSRKPGGSIKSTRAHQNLVSLPGKENTPAAGVDEFCRLSLSKNSSRANASLPR